MFRNKPVVVAVVHLSKANLFYVFPDGKRRHVVRLRAQEIHFAAVGTQPHYPGLPAAWPPPLILDPYCLIDQLMD